MSMISEQIQEIRECARECRQKDDETAKILRNAAGTIEDLSAKLAAENMERSSAYYNGGWIPCEEQMPEEHEGFCAKLKGTEKWKPYMFEKQSSKVIVTVVYPDNTASTAIARTQDGRWFLPNSYMPSGSVITHWMPLPEPYRSEEEE